MKNPQENVLFNEVKQGLQELNTVKLKDGSSAGIVTALYYYNLIAYNGQPGVQALTDLFEDIEVYNQNTNISDYNRFIEELDKSGTKLFSKYEEDNLLRLLAPVVSAYDTRSNYPYMYVLDPETNTYKLCRPVQKQSSNADESDPNIAELGLDEYIFNDDNEGEFGYTPRNFRTWDNVKSKLKIEEVNIQQELSSNSQIIFKDYEVNSDLYSIVENSDNPLQSIIDNKNSLIVSIKGTQMTLEQFINQAQELGWSEDEVMNIFQLIPKKRADGFKYNAIDLDILKHGLKSRSNQKPDC